MTSILVAHQNSTSRRTNLCRLGQHEDCLNLLCECPHHDPAREAAAELAKRVMAVGYDDLTFSLDDFSALRTRTFVTLATDIFAGEDVLLNLEDELAMLSLSDFSRGERIGIGVDEMSALRSVTR